MGIRLKALLKQMFESKMKCLKEFMVKNKPLMKAMQAVPSPDKDLQKYIETAKNLAGPIGKLRDEYLKIADGVTAVYNTGCIAQEECTAGLTEFAQYGQFDGLALFFVCTFAAICHDKGGRVADVVNVIKQLDDPSNPQVRPHEHTAKYAILRELRKKYNLEELLPVPPETDFVFGNYSL